MSGHKQDIKLICDSISGGRRGGVAHSTPTNQKPSNAPIFVHSSAGRVAAGQRPGRRLPPPPSSRCTPPLWQQRHQWQQQWWGVTIINNQQSTKSGGSNSNGNCDNSNNDK
jgi:hypothetical protein